MLADCEFFKVTKLELNGSKDIFSQNSFVSVLVLNGQIKLRYSGQILYASKGDSILIPCNLAVELLGNAEILLSTCNV